MNAEEIVARVTCPDIAELLGIELPDRIPGLVCCPVHDDSSPSLNLDETLWYCHGCGRGGSVIDLVMFVMGCTFAEAVRWLKAPASQLEPHERVVEERELPDLTSTYEKVKVSTPSTKNHDWCEFMEWGMEKWPHTGAGHVTARGWAKVGELNLWIPHYDWTVECATEEMPPIRGIKLRVMSRPKTGAKMAVKGSVFTHCLYRAELVDSPVAVLCEGETDTWTMQTWAPDIQVLGMPSGVGCLKRSFIEELRQYRRVWLMLDNDKPAEPTRRKLLEALPQAHDALFPDEFKDVTVAFAKGWRPRFC